MELLPLLLIDIIFVYISAELAHSWRPAIHMQQVAVAAGHVGGGQSNALLVLLSAHGVFCEAGHYPCNPQDIEEKNRPVMGRPARVPAP